MPIVPHAGGVFLWALCGAVMFWRLGRQVRSVGLRGQIGKALFGGAKKELRKLLCTFNDKSSSETASRRVELRAGV